MDVNNNNDTQKPVLFQSIHLLQNKKISNSNIREILLTPYGFVFSKSHFTVSKLYFVNLQNIVSKIKVKNLKINTLDYKDDNSFIVNRNTSFTMKGNNYVQDPKAEEEEQLLDEEKSAELPVSTSRYSLEKDEKSQRKKSIEVYRKKNFFVVAHIEKFVITGFATPFSQKYLSVSIRGIVNSSNEISKIAAANDYTISKMNRVNNVWMHMVDKKAILTILLSVPDTLPFSMKTLIRQYSLPFTELSDLENDGKEEVSDTE